MMYLGSPFGGGMVQGDRLHVTSARAASGDERSIIIESDVVVATPRRAAFLKR